MQVSYSLQTIVCLFCCMQTVSRELEEEALQRESAVDKQLKWLAAAAAVAERKRMEELKSRDQQIAELQVQ